ncbi:hypothetical protein BX600DRAFT_219804 [Xylariales sp. PMI_506]|nr:hypothetical protein BX600DRAFT_219804 [Xylariales sp. PMI_506]
MSHERIHDRATSNIMAWSSLGAHMQHEPEDDAAAEADEPPDNRTSRGIQSEFKRTIIWRPADHTQSLLTQALNHSDEDAAPLHITTSSSRRRSMNSTVSLASTADLTSDTGLTSPARTNTPSPPPPVIQLHRLNMELFGSKHKPDNTAYSTGQEETTPTKKSVIPTVTGVRPKDPAVEALAKKRCISFACGQKTESRKPTPPPQVTQPSRVTPAASTEEPPVRKTCIKFACTTKPSVQHTTPSSRQQPSIPGIVEPPKSERRGSPSTFRKQRDSSATRGARSVTPRRHSRSPINVRSKKYLSANNSDLKSESSRFHEFASDEPQEEDWVRQNMVAPVKRLTINDTLRKENEIRRLGREAEEEALQEEFEDDEPDNEDDPENADDDFDEEVEDDDDTDDDQSGYGSDDDASDGYNTDNEVGFADSDADDDDNDGLDLWTHGQAATLQLSGATPVNRRVSTNGDRFDSSASDSSASKRRTPREKSRRIKIRPGTPELPDSTDFVCGTLDEDRPLEDAYISCIAQRRREKLHVIPQDIDPSFPASEPEDEDETGLYDGGRDSDDHVWIHGELEDLDQDHGRADRRKKKSNHASPKRYHSPPPKRNHSPPPKARGRSPKRLFTQYSPRRLVSPPPSGRCLKSPPGSPSQLAMNGPIDFKTLAFRPGLTHTKSLPRAPAMFPHHLKGQRRRNAILTGAQGHVRGAIDIVKGLEHKRQRRREKYIQKHCNRARKGQAVGRRPQPGKGAERMRELGLYMAGKQQGPCNYVLSV